METNNLISQLNNTFGLDIIIESNPRGSAGSYVDGVIYLSTLDVIQSKVRGQLTRPNNFGVYNYPNTLSYPNVDLQQITIAHEFGHAIESAYRKDPLFKKCLAVCDSLAPKYISTYAGKDHPLSIHSEAFAETFALYMVSPNVLHSRNEELYSSINDFYISFL